MAKQPLWKDIVGTVAPTLASVLVGPQLGGLAGRILGKALGIEGASTDDLTKHIEANQTPEVFAALKIAEMTLVKELKELDIKIQEIDAGDRASARERQAKTGDKAPNYLAAVIIIGFFSILIALIFVVIPPDALSPLQIMLGALTSGLVQVLNFYFGSSAGSKQKADVITAMTKSSTGNGRQTLGD